MLSFFGSVSCTRASSVELEDIFDNSPAIMLLIEPATGQIIAANNAASNFYGYSVEALRNMYIQDINIFTSEQVAKERLLAKKEQRNFFIFRHKLANGEIKTVEVISSPITYAQSTVLFSIIRDISPERDSQREYWQYQANLENMVDMQVEAIEEKSIQIVLLLSVGLGAFLVVIIYLIRSLKFSRRAENELYQLSQVVEQSPVSVLRTDTNGVIDYVNKKFEQISGYSRQDVIGKKPNILKNEAPEHQEFEQLWSTISQGKIWVGEFHNRKKNGGMYWEKATIGPIKNMDGDVTHYIAIKEDISQLKEDEKRLRLASTVFRCATEAVMVTDANNRIQMVNDAFSEITGYEADEVIGHDPSILKSGHHDDAFYKTMSESLLNQDIWEGEIWNRRKNGEIYTEWLAITTIRDDLGQLEGYVSLFSDITKRKENEVRIRFQANFDTLTGLANRNLFTDRFSQALKHAERNKQQVALLFIDLDGFKHVNDTLGHSKGDDLLRDVATRIVESLRNSDTVARFGGDEFAVLLPDSAGVPELESIATKLQTSICSPFTLDGHEAYVSASIGIAFYPNDGNDIETLIRKADKAMYKAKALGRKNHQFFTIEMDEQAQQRRLLEHDLRTAMDNNEFELFFQPIIDSVTREISGAEALVRWRHPQKGLIPPMDFIPLAEDIGLIVALGEWVLREACKEAVIWQARYRNFPRIAVNISSHQFQRHDIAALTGAILAETGLAPEKLTLEITESLLINDDKATLAQMNAISALGVDLSIDDFGTGYSSLSYLKKFPITTLKIDRAFVTFVASNCEDEALVNAIISIAHSLNLKAVAEGVETVEQADLLKLKQCQFMQGYLFSKPLTKDEFIRFCDQKLTPS
ncbi:EAL domain-containing protein [Colwelliaceae bacterium 6471]